MKIALSMATYNRLHYLKMTAQSLHRSNELSACDLRLYDDCSTEYDVDVLRQLFPEARDIVRREKNLGADGNMFQVYRDFLDTTDDVLITLDSDMLVHPRFLEVVIRYLPKTDGVLSLYNSAMHPANNPIVLDGIACLEKDHVGAAAVAMSREVVRAIVTNVLPGKAYDWRWSKYLRDAGKRILVTRDSYVQHVGMHGYNCDGGRSVDFGLNFYPENLVDQQIATDFLQELLVAKDKHIEELYRSVSYNLGNLFVLPVRGTYRIFRRLIKRGA